MPEHNCRSVPLREADAQLIDLALARLDGCRYVHDGISHLIELPDRRHSLRLLAFHATSSTCFCPSRRWDQAGPRMEQSGAFPSLNPDSQNASDRFQAGEGACRMTGETPLMASMRAVLALSMGPDADIDIPASPVRW